MLSDALKFWESIAGKVKQLIRGETQNAFRCERYEVSTAPNGSVMGVKKPFGNEILLPYSKEVAEAVVGDPVLVVWWNSMSNAKVYYYANGYEGTTGGGGDEDSSVVIATISLPLSWNDSGSGYYTVTPTVSGATVSAVGKVDLQPTQSQTIQLQSDGVTALYVENNAGVLTAYAIGNAPTTAMTMQCTVEDTTATSGVRGDTLGVGAALAPWTNLPIPTPSLINCTGSVAQGLSTLKLSADGKHVCVGGRIRITGYAKTAANPGVSYQTALRPASNVSAYVGVRSDGNTVRPEAVVAYISTSGLLSFTTTETMTNATTNPTIFMVFETIIPLE